MTDLTDMSMSQWAALGVGALVSWFIFNWISNPSPKKFTVPVPEGNSDVVMSNRWFQPHLSFVSTLFKWKHF